jgi:hypothetical protein
MIAFEMRFAKELVKRTAEDQREIYRIFEHLGFRRHECAST